MWVICFEHDNYFDSVIKVSPVINHYRDSWMLVNV
jgi:hypothetical protein